MFFFTKHRKVHPDAEVTKQEAEPSVNTKGKVFFKNLRLRRKLRSAEKIETPKSVVDKIGECSRLRKFINFFKISTIKAKVTFRRRVKICPATTPIPDDNVETIQNQLKEKFAEMSQRYVISQDDIDKVLASHEPSSTSLPNVDMDQVVETSQTNSPKVGQNQVVESFETSPAKADSDVRVETHETNSPKAPTDDTAIESLDDDKNLTQQESKKLFQSIELKLAEKKNDKKLPPIEGGKRKCLELENVVFKNTFYRCDLNDYDTAIPRPGTPRPSTPSRAVKKVPTMHEVKIKQVRANELRNQSKMKRLRPHTARKERYQQRKAIVDSHVQAQRYEEEKRRVQAAENKVRADNEKLDRIKTQNAEWDRRYQNQLVLEEQQREDAKLKVVRKRNATDLVCERKDNRVETKTKKLHNKHVNISVRAEMLSRPGTPRPVTAPVDGAFRSRQPTNEDDHLLC